VAVSPHLGPLYLTRYRLYSASLNRFLSADPLGLAGGLNLYAYAEGDPLSYIDPLGLGAEEKSGGWQGFLTRLGGLGQMLGGAAEAAAGYTFGTVTSPTVAGGILGAAIGTHGIDNVQAGARQMWTGRPVDTMSSGMLQSAGLSRQTANTVNAVVSVAATLGTSAANMAATTAPIPTTAKPIVLGDTALQGVSDDMMVHFSQTGNRASLVQSGVQAQGGYSYFFRVGDVKSLTAAQARGAVGALANAGANNNLAVIVSPSAASFTRVGAGFPQYMTSQNSVPWVVIRNVAGGAP
jgi:uncharacterized protein RhaS with RHS repeats